MKDSNLKNGLYVGFTIFVIILMILFTWLYLSNRKDIKGDVPNVHKTVSSTEKSSTDDEKNVSDTEITVSSSSTTTNVGNEKLQSTTETSVSTESSVPYVSEFRFLYTAAGGDTLQTVSELTGVDVSTIAQTNGLTEDIVLVKDQRVYVP